MSEAEMNSYRFNSGQDPTDEMLAQIMREAAEDAKRRHEEAPKNTLRNYVLVLMNNKPNGLTALTKSRMATVEHKPELIIIAGPNGSGKTSITQKFLHHEWAEGTTYISI